MRSLAVFFIFSFIISTSLVAQDVSTAKTFYEEGKLDRAKSAIDAAVKESAANLPEACIWKYKIYNSIAKNTAYSNLVPNAAKEAFEAIKKAYDMPGGTDGLIKELGVGYMSKFNDCYIGFISSGSGKMNKKNYADAFEDFKSALAASDFFYKKKMITIDLDTALTFYAGYCAFQNKDDKSAEYYFKKLVDRGAYGADVQIAYGWLCNYYLEKTKDIEAAKLVCSKGLKIYPSDEYLRSKSIEITRAGNNIEDLFKQYEETLAKPGAAFTDYLAYGAELYDYLFVNEDNHTINNTEAKRIRMKDVLLKALQLKPASAEANYILGMYYTSIAMEINKQAEGATVDRKTALNKIVDSNANASITYLEKAASLFTANPNLSSNKKVQLKTALQQLINLYNYLQQPAKSQETEEKLSKL